MKGSVTYFMKDHERKTKNVILSDSALAELYRRICVEKKTLRYILINQDYSV